MKHNTTFPRRSRPRLALAAASVLLAATAGVCLAADKVTISKSANGVSFVADGKPLRIKGVGGSGDLKLLAECGGNAVRTWGVGDDTQAVLDDARKNGVGVVLGIWMNRESDQHMDYDDAKLKADQLAGVRDAVAKFKGHPALLAWSLGNEMEGYQQGDDVNMWKQVEACAALVKQLDPNHPTMTVTAEIGGQRVQSVHKYCPSIDIMGINSYGGAASIPKRYRAAVPAGMTPKPYMVTEYGPAGTWEIGLNSFKAAEELTSTQKAKVYADIYRDLAADRDLCLGSFAFTWGFKREATSTWFGLFLNDGSKLGAVDALAAAWGGKVDNHCPTIQPLKVAGNAAGVTKPGQTVEVRTKVADPDGDDVTVAWTLSGEQGTYFTNGEAQDATAEFPDAIVKADHDEVTLKMPAEPGVYRLYAVVHDGKHAAATANVPLLVDGPATTTVQAEADKKPAGDAPKAPKATLPLVIAGDETAKPSGYIPSGYMGETASIKIDPASATDPHAGKTCMKVTYDKGDAWGGVFWQSPADDWGAKPGGLDLTGAKTLSFWAKGAKGGEKVAFGMGGIARDQPYFDTAEKNLETALTGEWKRYEIDLTGLDLSRIKSGFRWSLAGQGEPVVFYLDDVKYE